MIIRHLARIEESIKDLQQTQNEILGRLRSSSAAPPATSLPDGITAPCDNLSDLQDLEKWLLIENNDKLLVRYFSILVLVQCTDKTSKQLESSFYLTRAMFLQFILYPTKNLLA